MLRSGSQAALVRAFVCIGLGLGLGAGRAHAQAPGRTLGAAGSALPTLEDAAAGLTDLRFPWRGSRRLVALPGEVPAPGSGALHRVRINVEGGLPVDAAVFAGFVMDTLNDPRGWGHDGKRTFARTAGEAELTVTLASPGTTATLCLPYETLGILSCGKRGHAILTLHRWVLGAASYGEADQRMTDYRRYLINHEVGHVLGLDHARCRRRGALAPVMLPQTKGLWGCRPNPWPFAQP